MPLEGGRSTASQAAIHSPALVFNPANGVLTPEAGKYFPENCQFYQFTPAKDSVTMQPTDFCRFGSVSAERGEKYRRMSRQTRLIFTVLLVALPMVLIAVATVLSNFN